jgi:dolichol-phosphate mannosyltransferase
MPLAPRGMQSEIEAAPTGPLAVPPAPAGSDGLLLSLVVPTLNERENIRDFLVEVRRGLDGVAPGRYEVIVVDDDSPDGTCELAASLMPGFPELHVVRRRGEGGLAAAVIRGWQVSRGEVVGTINADFQHPPSILPRMINALEGADLVVGTRHGDGGGLGDWGLMRRFTSRGAAWIGRVLLPEVFARVSDPLSGCYFVRRASIAGVELKPLGYKSLMEVLVRGRVGAIRECGYQMRRRSRGQSKVHALHPLHYLRHIVRLRAARGASRR